MKLMRMPASRKRGLLSLFLLGMATQFPAPARADLITELTFEGTPEADILCGRTMTLTLDAEGTLDSAPSRDLIVTLFADDERITDLSKTVSTPDWTTQLTFTVECTPDCRLIIDGVAIGKVSATLSATGHLGDAEINSTNELGVRCVPEPGSLILLVLGVAGLLRITGGVASRTSPANRQPWSLSARPYRAVR